MYLAFFFWHGVYLDEISQLNYSTGLFYLFAGITYLVISFLLIKLFDLKATKKIFGNIFMRGLASGLIVGVIVFVVTRVTGIGIGKSVTMNHLLLDVVWQCVEEVSGGMIVSLGAFFIFDPSLEEHH